MSGDWLDTLVFGGASFPEDRDTADRRGNAVLRTRLEDSWDGAVAPGSSGNTSIGEARQDTTDRRDSEDSVSPRPVEDAAPAATARGRDNPRDGTAPRDSGAPSRRDRDDGKDTGDSQSPATELARSAADYEPAGERRPRFTVSASGDTVDLAQRPAGDSEDGGVTESGRRGAIPAAPANPASAGDSSPETGQDSEDTRDAGQDRGHDEGQDTGDNGRPGTAGNASRPRTRWIRVTGTGRIPPPGRVVDLDEVDLDEFAATQDDDFEGEPEPDGRGSGFRRLTSAVRRGVGGMPPGGTRRAAEAGTDWVVEQGPQVPHHLAKRVATRWSLPGPVARWCVYNGAAAGAGQAVDWLSGGEYPGLPSVVSNVLLTAAADVGYLAASIIGLVTTGVVWVAIDAGPRAWCAAKADTARASNRPIDRATNFWFLPAWLFRIPLASTATGATVALGAAVIQFTTGAQQ